MDKSVFSGELTCQYGYAADPRRGRGVQAVYVLDGRGAGGRDFFLM